MTAYILLLRTYPRHIGFGFLLTFFSSLGQTFLLSLYVSYILAEMGITNSLFGTMYAAATITASLLLMTFGGGIDHKPLDTYLYKAVGLLSVATIALGLLQHPLLLPVALLGLRFAGQGLLSHISGTVMGRYFDEDRGKALSLSSLGYSVGEMAFPLLITAMIPLVGWRVSLIINLLVLLAVMIPALQFMPMEDLDHHRVDTVNRTSEQTARWKILQSPEFWMLAPSVIALSFTNTSVFFYQLVLAQSRGWGAQWYAMIFSGYAIARFAFGLFGGPLVDRYTAKRVYPFTLIPMTIGLVVLALYEQPWSAVVFLLTAGVSIGSSGPAKQAVIAELHGTLGLGGIRSLYTAAMVFGTALGPMVLGFFLDGGSGFTPVLLGLSLLLGLSVVNSCRMLLPSALQHS